MRVVVGFLAAAAFAAQAPKSSHLRQGYGGQASPRVTNGEWPSYGGTNWSQKYSPLDHITRQNFGDLKVAWTWSSPDHDLIKRIPDNPEEPYTANGLKATPLVVKGVMYISTGPC